MLLLLNPTDLIFLEGLRRGILRGLAHHLPLVPPRFSPLICNQS
jgi:hypothetical protein